MCALNNNLGGQSFIPLSSSAPPLFWDRFPNLTWISSHGFSWLPSKPQGSACSHLPRACATTSGFCFLLHGFKRSKSGPHAYKARALPTEFAPPHPSLFFLYSSGWLGPYYVVQVRLKLEIPLPLPAECLRLQMCATKPSCSAGISEPEPWFGTS